MIKVRLFKQSDHLEIFPSITLLNIIRVLLTVQVNFIKTPIYLPSYPFYFPLTVTIFWQTFHKIMILLRHSI